MFRRRTTRLVSDDSSPSLQYALNGSKISHFLAIQIVIVLERLLQPRVQRVATFQLISRFNLFENGPFWGHCPHKTNQDNYWNGSSKFGGGNLVAFARHWHWFGSLEHLTFYESLCTAWSLVEVKTSNEMFKGLHGHSLQVNHYATAIVVLQLLCWLCPFVPHSSFVREFGVIQDSKCNCVQRRSAHRCATAIVDDSLGCK